MSIKTNRICGNQEENNAEIKNNATANTEENTTE